MHKPAQVELQLDWSQLSYLEYSDLLSQKAAQSNAQYKKGPYRNVVRERTGHNNDQNDIVDVKKEMKIASPSIIQVTMDHDDTILVKKESRIKSTSLVQDKIDKDDTIFVEKDSKIISTSLVQDKMNKMIWYTLKKNLRQSYHFNPRRIGERLQCSHCWANPIQTNT